MNRVVLRIRDPLERLPEENTQEKRVERDTVDSAYLIVSIKRGRA